MSDLRILLFGSPRIELDDAAIEFRRRKVLALLIYLAVTGQTHSRDALATLFYPDHSQRKARAYLRRDLSLLNAALLADWLEVNRETVELKGDFWSDIAHFGHLIAACHEQNDQKSAISTTCLKRLGEAADLYTADFLAGFTLRDCPDFDDWQFFQTESLRQELAAVLRQLSQGYCQQGDPEAAIPYARRWVTLDSLHEPARRMLMLAYDQAGQQAAALRQYEGFTELLDAEMGLPPSEETQTIYEAIKAKRLLEPHLKSVGSQDAGGVGPVSTPSPGAPAFRLVARPFAPADQQLSFTTSADGTRLAYAVVGQGPPLVKVANPLTHLQYDWESPVWRHWIEALSHNHTLIRYDERGCGLSQREVTDFSIEAWVNDLEAVVNAQGLTRFPIIGTSQGTSIAVAYAARHPEKVSHLILHGGYARGRFHREPTPEQRVEIETLLNTIRVGWGQDTPAFRQIFATLFVPGGSPAQHAWFCELARVTTEPETAATMERAFYEIDVRPAAAQVVAPTLVTHPRNDAMVPFEEGRLLAELIPSARLVPLESNNHLLLDNEPAWSQFLDEVQRFLQTETGLPDVSPVSALKLRPVDQPVPQHRLPTPITSFIGRERDVAAVSTILAKNRLLTLTGPGGIGKTRLALAVAQQLGNTFADGIYFVDLSTISQPMFVASKIAGVLGVIEVETEPLAERLKNALIERDLLLVLDNFEHVIKAASLIADLLKAASGLKLLVTSREVLQVYGETTYNVPPLSLYDGRQGETWDQSEAVQLFLQRAQAIEPNFQITSENEAVIAEICRRMDGLPLGIELAAARVKMLPPTLILERLDQTSLTMRGGGSGIPERQMTLGQAIGWSIALLDPAEKRLFTHLSVFRGGGTLEAIERVCVPDLDLDHFSSLESLVNKSLVRREKDIEGIPRFAMLETLRSYAQTLLEDPVKADALHRRHAGYFAEAAEQLGTRLHSSQQPVMLNRLEAEISNFYAAMLWSINHHPDIGLRLIAALGTCWHIRSHFVNAFRMAQEVLLAGESAPALLRAQALCSTTDLALLLGHYDRGTAMGQQALDLARQVGDKETIAWALHLNGRAKLHPKLPPTELEEIADRLQEAIGLYLQLGNSLGAARVRLTQSSLDFLRGAITQAVDLSERSLDDFQRLDFQSGVVAALRNRAWLAYEQSDRARAEIWFRESLERAHALQYTHAATLALIGLARLYAEAGRASLAAQLVGAATAIQRNIGSTLTPMQQLRYEQTDVAIRNALNDTDYQTAHRAGQQLSLTEAVSLAQASTGAGA